MISKSGPMISPRTGVIASPSLSSEGNDPGAARDRGLASVGGDGREGGQNLIERGVVGAVVVEMLVPDLVAGPDHERGPELGDTASRLVDPVPVGPRPLGSRPAPPVR